MNSELKSQMNGGGLVSFKEAASMLPICPRTLRRKVDARKVAVVRIGRLVFFHRSDIMRILEQGLP